MTDRAARVAPLPTATLAEVAVAPRRPKLSWLARLSAFWAVFIGLGALAGVVMMWTAAERFGMGQLLAPMERLPFGRLISANFVIPGLALLLVIGVPHLLAFFLVLRRHRLGAWAVLAAGIILLFWLMLQLFVLYGPNPTTNMYLAFALLEIISVLCWMRSRGYISDQSSRAEL